MFVGAGGTGKSTVAAAAALGLAGSGRRVLLASIDQSHSLTDVLAVPASRTGEAAAVRRLRSGVDLVEIDTLGVLESRYRSMAGLLSLAGRHDHGTGLSALDPEELTGVPGAQDLVGLQEVLGFATRGDWDYVLVDCPGIADWLRIAAVPSMVSDYLERVWPRHRRVSAGIGRDPRLTVLVALLERIDAGAAEVREMLADSENTSATVVATAESVVLHRTRELLAATSLLGVCVDEVIVNKVVPQLGSAPSSVLGTHPAVFWLEAQRSAQQQLLAEFVADVAPVRVRTVGTCAREPVGWVSLEEIANDVIDPERSTGTSAHPSADPVVGLESGSGLESVYVMAVHLPLVDAGTVSVGRVEDDVIVSAGGVRRRFRLASVLRRCNVVSAEFDDDTLFIRFVPDPSVWPQ